MGWQYTVPSVNQPAVLATTLLVFGLLTGASAQAQEAPTSRDDGGPARTQAAQREMRQEPAQPEMTRPADGSRHGGLPAEAYAVVPGTRCWCGSRKIWVPVTARRAGDSAARTLEPLLAGSGIYLPSGAQILGHVSRVQPAAVVAGRAKIWLVFDEIRTRFGPLPIVASVVGVPGDHSVRTSPEKEGLIEGKTSTQQAAGQAAAEGAGMGALHGIKDKNAKEAAEGAAEAALAAYLMEAGRGHELELVKGSKLEIELERALYLLKD